MTFTVNHSAFDGKPMPDNPSDGLAKRWNEAESSIKTLLNKIRQRPPKHLDQTFQALDAEVFSHTDCKTCANCCKTTGPLFTQRDIERISRKLRMKQAEFTEKYLRRDEDDDLVLQKVPCAFLGDDNLCGIYDFKPEACSDYPHTARRKQHTLLGLHLKNAAVCPAVLEILQKLKNSLDRP